MIQIVEDVAVERLRRRMGEREVTVEDVWDFIILQHQPGPGMVMQNLADFVTQQDISNFWWVYDWWAPVENKPQNLPTPAIIQFCWFVNHAADMPAVTFNDALQQFYSKAVAHCQNANIDPANPGESADERRKRRNRERMAKVRGARQVPDKVLAGDVNLATQVRALEEQIEGLKSESKVADEWHATEVKRHQAAMIEASQSRKATAAAFQIQVEKLRTEIHNLTAKQ